MALYGVRQVNGGTWLAVIEFGPDVENGERVIAGLPNYKPFHDAAMAFCHAQRLDPQAAREKEFVAKAEQWRRSLGKFGELVTRGE